MRAIAFAMVTSATLVADVYATIHGKPAGGFYFTILVGSLLGIVLS